YRAELADAQRQLAVAVDLRLEDLDVSGAVHRLDPEAGGGALPPSRPGRVVQEQRAVHVLAVLLEVARALVDLLVRDVRRIDQRGAPRAMEHVPPSIDVRTNDR